MKLSAQNRREEPIKIERSHRTGCQRSGWLKLPGLSNGLDTG